MGCLLDALSRAYEVLGLGRAAGSGQRAAGSVPKYGPALPMITIEQVPAPNGGIFLVVIASVGQAVRSVWVQEADLPFG